VHQNIYQEVVDKMIKAYSKVTIGDPLQEGILMGPLHTQAAVEEFTTGMETIRA